MLDISSCLDAVDRYHVYLSPALDSHLRSVSRALQSLPVRKSTRVINKQLFLRKLRRENLWLSFERSRWADLMRFVFPLDMEVPYGQVMLSILIDRGFVPELVIEEESPEAEHHRSLFLDRLGATPLAPTIASQVEKRNLRYARLDNLCDPECERLIKQQKPDLIALGGTRRLIKRNIFAIPPWGTLCSHPGLLPYVRGAASPAWSILHDLRVGCSCFIVDEGLDTGPVIKSKIVPVYSADTYADIVKRNIVYCAELMAEVLQLFREKGGPIAGEPQDLSVGKTYRTMPLDLVEVVRGKLKDKAYQWLEDRQA